MQTRWGIEYASRFINKMIGLNSPLASDRLEKLCEWIANQTDPEKIVNCETCADTINKKLYFPTYGWNIVFRFDGQDIVFVMFYNAAGE